MSARRLGRVAWVVAAPLLLMGVREPGGLGTSSGGDTLTASYQVSGVRVIQRVNPATDVVAVRLYLLGGTRQLTERTAGIEALFLRAAAYGTAQFKDDEARRALDRTGCVVALDPDLDWTVFGFTGLAEDLDAAWRPFADRLTHPTLSDAAVAQARAKLLSEAHRRYTEPDERLRVLAMRALFRDHPYALDPSGTETSLAAITPDDVRTYVREQVVASRMMLVVVGNVLRAHVESLVTATIAQLPHGQYQWTLPPPAPSQDVHYWLIEDRPFPTAYLLGLFSGPPPTSHDYWSFRVAAALLSSRLFTTVRIQRSLSYAAFVPYVDAAIPIAGVYVSTPKPAEVRVLVANQIVALMGIPDNVGLGRFIDNFRFDYLAENATAASQAEFLARAELYLGSYRLGDDFMKRLHGVSPRDIRVMASQYMTRIQYSYLGDSSRMHGRW